MKNKQIFSLVVLSAVASLAASPAMAKGWIIKLNRTQNADGFLRSHRLKGRVLDSRTSARWLKVDALPSSVLATGKSALSSIPGVEYIEEDRIVSINMGGKKPADPQDPAAGKPEITPNDALFSRLWGLAGVNEKGSIRATHAWYHTRNRKLSQVVVGVLDTGVAYNHEDLKSVLWKTTRNGQSVQGIDAIQGDFYAADDQGHGTHVAGTIAASSGNKVGVAGVAPNAKIFPMKFLGANGSGTTSDAIEALDLAYEFSEIKVINHSWGGPGASRALQEAFERGRERGVLMIVAAGNEGANNDRVVSSPANIRLDNVISVGALSSFADLTNFSNYGKGTVDLAAPGDFIFSSIFNKNNAYEALSGTSMAAPHVSGAAALIWGLRPDWTYLQVREHLLRQVRPVSALTKYTVTGGTLDLYRAVKDL